MIDTSVAPLLPEIPAVKSDGDVAKKGQVRPGLGIYFECLSRACCSAIANQAPIFETDLKFKRAMKATFADKTAERMGMGLIAR